MQQTASNTPQQSAERDAAPTSRQPSANAAMPVELTVNGNVYTLSLDPRTTLLDALREHLHLTGTKKGCDHGQCGACTVHVNGRRVNCVPEPGRSRTTATRSPPSKASVRPERCIRCRRRSSNATAISAATARRARSCPRSRCSMKRLGPADDEVREAMSGNHLPLRRLPEHRRGDPAVRGKSERSATWKSFSCRAPTACEHAIAAARLQLRPSKAHSVRFLAGGTTLLDLMKLDVERPTRVIDINRLPLDRIEAIADGGVKIGATVRNADLAHHPLIRALSGAVAGAALGRLGPIAQHGDDRRQPAATHALRLLPRHRDAMQQARAGLGLSGDRGVQSQPGHPGDQRCTASRPIRPT